ncbi:DUF547 domain-containing protein [Alteromonas sp. CYL-A6]|uniref:DUF547 domain-containing protein n=1 Tax=Alteromonas nitratireducens TaxID=3390813 RepID=UPI0034AE3C49
MKSILAVLLFSLLWSAGMQAQTSSRYAPFMSADNNSELTIAYDDLDEFLNASVYVVGRSTREKAPRASGTTGTRLKNRVNRLTALEGNRFYFDILQSTDYTDILTAIHQSLAALPDEVPLSGFNRNEQLAYWLNLYNFTLFSELAKEGGYIDMRRLLDDDDDSLLNRKAVTVAGVPLSLNDIHFDILLQKYHGDPLVIYGLFQGVIGGPTLQDEAFKGETVWKQLERLASDFINSNRGTYYDGRLSAYYQRNLAFFDNDKQKLKDHVLDYLEDDVYQDIAATAANDLELDIEDLNLADIGGGREYGAGLMKNNAALIDSANVEQRAGSVTFATQNFLAEGLIRKSRLNVRFSADELEVLNGIRQQHEINAGRVKVTDLSKEEATKEKEQR